MASETGSTEKLKTGSESASSADMIAVTLPEKTLEDDPEFDPWALADPPASGTPWSEKTRSQKVNGVLIALLKLAILLGLLYLFICSLDMLSNAFRLLGGKAASQVFQNNAVLSNPIADLVIGVLVTVLVQSSSTSTSIVVSMVAAKLLTVRPAIFIIMGANIGTSVTNTIVAMGQVGNRNEFRRAFAGATVHDMFNWLSVIIILPIEWISGSIGSWKGCGVLCQLTGAMVEGLNPETNPNAKKDLLKVITKPLTDAIIQLDKNQLNAIAKGDAMASDVSLIKHECKALVPQAVFVPGNNTCKIEWVQGYEQCNFLFEDASKRWSDAVVGVCLLFLALTCLCVCLALIVKLLHSLLRGRIARIIKKTVNSDFPGVFRHLTGYLAIIVGALLTILLQSSSIFTSAITPLVGVGVLRLERMYPLTLGANIGTTFTAILAAMASEDLYLPLQVALCHLFFNIFGILIWYPVPYMRAIPIKLARGLGNTTAQYRWFAFVYLLVMFFLFPAAIFGLSVPGWYVLLAVGLPLLIVIMFIVIVNIFQRKKASSLPAKLRSWSWLPEPMRSLDPYDRLITKCCCCIKSQLTDDTEVHSHPVTNGIPPLENGHANKSYIQDIRF